MNCLEIPTTHIIPLLEAPLQRNLKWHLYKSSTWVEILQFLIVCYSSLRKRKYPSSHTRTRITHARPSFFSRLPSPHTRTNGHNPHSHRPQHSKQAAMELLLLPSRATVSRRLLPTAPVRRASAATFRPAASPGNVEATTDATATTSVAKTGQEWGAGGRQGQTPFGLGLDLSEEMRRGMMWRMLAFPAAAVAAEAALLWVLDSGVDAPAWAGKAGSAVLFAAGLLGSQYGFFSSRWDAAETGSMVGWELAVRHWNALSMARGSSTEEQDDEDDEEWEWVYEDDDEETED